ncbi:uncharacterized protein UHOD_11370 [Ustilago sp. UG-2017b]|nr:uncharacterized protein UHOD_11370 [Ustilago sp. UG-2017b]
METMETEDQAHMRGGPSTATRRTELKEHTDGYHSGARETRVKGTVTGRRRRGSYLMKRVLSGERAGAVSLATL